MPSDESRKRARKTKGIAVVNRIKKSVDVKTILEHYKAKRVKKSSGDFINCSCPLPSHGGEDSSPSFGIVDAKGTDKNGNYKCFKCGGGDIIDFIKKMEGTDFHGAKNFLTSLGGIEDPYSEGLLDREVNEIKEEEETNDLENIRQTFIPPILNNNLYVARYLVENESRNFDFKRAMKIIERFKIGIGWYFGKIRIIVPIFDHYGNLITFFAQNADDNSDKLFAKGAKTGLLLFALNHFVKKTNRIILTEGIWDALKIISYGLPAVASFSTSFTPQQANLIVSYFDEVYVAFDADKGGRKGTEKVAKLLYPTVSIKMVELPDEKDPCNCTKTELKKAINKAKNMQFFDEDLL